MINKIFRSYRDPESLIGWGWVLDWDEGYKVLTLFAVINRRRYEAKIFIPGDPVLDSPSVRDIARKVWKPLNDRTYRG